LEKLFGDENFKNSRVAISSPHIFERNSSLIKSHALGIFKGGVRMAVVNSVLDIKN
jgi:hypothetical protein